MKAVRYTAEATQDLHGIADFLAEVHREISIRFLDSAAETLLLIASQPAVGAIVHHVSPTMAQAGIRYIPVKGFPRHLVFYRLMEDEVIVTRVLHGARDIASLFRSDS